MNDHAAAHALVEHARTLFEDAERADRATLGDAELDLLLEPLAVARRAETAQPVAGGELRIAITGTREFGPVIEVGVGGAARAFANDSFAKDRATVMASAELIDAGELLERVRATFAYRAIAAACQRLGEALPDAALESCFAGLLELARGFSAGDPDAPFVIESLELDPVTVHAGQLAAGGAACRFGKATPGPLPRPVHKIDKLVHPQSLGIIGVSASKMNFGRIILNNIIDSGYDRAKMTIIRPGETEIDGVQCAESLAALDEKLDLFIVAVAADAVYDLVDEIIATDAAETVMLIPGGLGETEKSRAPAAAMAERINAAHAKEGGGPIFLGANCLGVVSHPGHYDSWFIPLERLPKPAKKPERDSVLISQSGAFMITRLSRNPWLDPRYMLAIGNQTDLTHGDMIGYFAELPEIRTIGCYIEGFRDLDGLAFARAVRRATAHGKTVVIYKSGRTEYGENAALGHTASLAGDWTLCEAVLSQAGAIFTREITQFDDLLYIAGALQDKRIGGNRLGAISGAGFEAVGMADSVAVDGFSMTLGRINGETVARVGEILDAKRLTALVEIRNPIDINPGADDEAHLQITEAFANDPEIDAVVVGLDPTAPSIRALVESRNRPGFDLDDPKSTAHLMPPLVERNDKPIIGVVDGGPLYDAMAARLMDRGVCVFRTCTRAVEALARYVGARLAAERIRARDA